MGKRIFVTGGTGFVGTYVVQQLLLRKYKVRLLVRPGSESKLLFSNVELAFGDVSDPDSLQRGMKGCDAVINLIGIIREFPKKGITFQRMHVDATKLLIDAAKKHKIKRFIQMSALGVRAGATTQYFRTKYEAEQYVRNSGLAYTLFRPSMMFGKEDISINVIASSIQKTGMFPIFGDGRYKIQPVSVEDVAKIIVISLANRKMANKVYDVAGPKQYTFEEFVETISDVSMHRVWIFNIPLGFGRLVVSLLQRAKKFPMTRDALEMLVEGNITDDMQVYKDAKVKPTEFEKKAPDYMSRSA